MPRRKLSPAMHEALRFAEEEGRLERDPESGRWAPPSAFEADASDLHPCWEHFTIASLLRRRRLVDAAPSGEPEARRAVELPETR